MQEAAVVLSVLRERGRRGLPCTQLYRQKVTEGGLGGELKEVMEANFGGMEQGMGK